MISKKSELYTVEFNKSCIFKKALVVIQSQSVFQYTVKSTKFMEMTSAFLQIS